MLLLHDSYFPKFHGVIIQLTILLFYEETSGTFGLSDQEVEQLLPLEQASCF